MTLQDLTDYEVRWADALTAEIGNGYSVWSPAYTSMRCPRSNNVRLASSSAVVRAAFPCRVPMVGRYIRSKNQKNTKPRATALIAGEVDVIGLRVVDGQELL
jgi:hypothetical protein